MRRDRSKTADRNGLGLIVDRIRTMDRKRLGLIAGIVAAALVMIALGVRSWMKEHGQQGSVIKIGAILPQTGPGAVFAEEIEEGINLAVSEINSNEREKPHIKILYEDSKNQPKEGITVYNKLVSTEHPPVVIVALSSVAKALRPLAEPTKTAQVYIAVALPNSADPNSKENITDGRYSFRIYPEASGMAGVMARYNATTLKTQTSAVIYLNDDFGLVSLNAYKEAFEAAGGRVVFAESYELQQTDFRPLISKLKNVSPAPDLIYLSGYGPSYGAVIKQLKEQGVQSQITADMTMGLPNTIAQVGKAAEGLYFVDGKMSEGFIRDYKAAYGEDKKPSSYAGYAYDIVKLLHRTAQEGQGAFNLETIRRGLTNRRDYTGAMGRIEMEPNGDSKLEFIVKYIKSIGDGEPVIVEPLKEKP